MKKVALLILLALFSAVAGALAAWSMAKEAGVALRQTLSTQTSIELQTLKSDAALKRIALGLPEGPQRNQINELVDSQLALHPTLLLSLTPKLGDLSKDQLLTLCQLASDWKAFNITSTNSDSAAIAVFGLRDAIEARKGQGNIPATGCSGLAAK